MKSKLDVFAPHIAFPALFIASYLLSILRLSTEIEPFSIYTHLFIIVAILAYLAGCFVVFSKHNKQNDMEKSKKNKIKIVTPVILAYLISLSLLFYEYMSYGGIPLLSEALEIERGEFMKSGYIHMIALSIMPIMVLLSTVLLTNYKKYKMLKIIIIILIAVGVGALLGLGNRGQIAIVSIIIIIYRHYYIKRFTVFQTLSILLAGLILLSLAKYSREYIFFGEHYVGSVAETWFIGDNLAWLSPGYLTLTMNFQIFSRLVDTFPDTMGVTHGRFILNPILSPLQLGPKEDLGDFINRNWNTGFYGQLTSTYLGAPYIDFGVIGIAVVSFVLGLIVTTVYIRMKKKPSHVNVIAYSFLATYMLLCVYTYPFQYTYIYWMLFLSIYLGKKIESRYL